MKFIGIDPGNDGCLAELEDNQLKQHDIPKLKIRHKNGKVRQIVNGHALAGIIGDKPANVVIEKVQPWGKDDQYTAFYFGANFGGIISAVLATGSQIQLVTPQEWKKSYGLIGANKVDSKRAAIATFPEYEKLLRAGRVDKSEAALLAGICRDLSKLGCFVHAFGEEKAA